MKRITRQKEVPLFTSGIGILKFTVAVRGREKVNDIVRIIGRNLEVLPQQETLYR